LKDLVWCPQYIGASAVAEMDSGPSGNLLFLHIHSWRSMARGIVLPVTGFIRNLVPVWGKIKLQTPCFIGFSMAHGLLESQPPLLKVLLSRNLNSCFMTSHYTLWGHNPLNLSLISHSPVRELLTFLIVNDIDPSIREPRGRCRLPFGREMISRMVSDAFHPESFDCHLQFQGCMHRSSARVRTTAHPGRSHSSF
jgi:hypothetical protein